MQTEELLSELEGFLSEGQSRDRIARGLRRYSAIQDSLPNSADLRIDKSFQRAFGSYYGMRRNDNWRQEFFIVMQEVRREPPNFRSVLHALARRLGRSEASFASKLAATFDPTLPVIDGNVLAVMRAFAPEEATWRLNRVGHLEDRLRAAETLHDALRMVFATTIAAPTFARLRQCFASVVMAGVEVRTPTDAKVLDLVLWQFGRRLLNAQRDRPSPAVLPTP